MNLERRIVVVTGGSTGIGRATAEKFGRAGCRLAICARTPADLEAAADSLRAAGIETLADSVDVTSEEQVLRFRDRVETELGTADVLVNNAGIGIFGKIQDLSAADYDRVFDVNVRGLFLCTSAFVPGMIHREDGVIVNVASIAAKNHFSGGSVYSGSKHAVLGMSKCMMLDLRPHNVRVLTVCPGSVHTPFFSKVEHPTLNPDRVLRAEDVAEIIVDAVRMSDRGTVSEVEIRPISP